MWIKFLPYIVGLALVLGVIGYIYHKGQIDEQTRNAQKTLKHEQEERGARELIEERNRNLDDDTATKRLRPGGSQ